MRLQKRFPLAKVMTSGLCGSDLPTPSGLVRREIRCASNLETLPETLLETLLVQGSRHQNSVEGREALHQEWRAIC